MASRAPTAVLSLLLLLSYVDSHSVGVGSCKPVTPMSGFDVTKYLGKWYINEISSHISNCLVLFFEQHPDVPNEIKATQSRETPALGTFGVHHTNNYTGTIVKGDAAHPAAMSIKWPTSGRFIGSMSYTVIDTDNGHFALTFECATLGGFLRYYSATILSRNATLDPTTLQKVRDAAAAAGIDVSDLRPVSQGNCAQQDAGIPQGGGNHSSSGNHSSPNVLGLLDDQRIEEIQNHSELIEEIGFPKQHGPN